MSRDYYPKKPAMTSFNLNVADCEIMTMFIEHFQITHAQRDSFTKRMNPPWSATSERARAMAAELAAITDSRLKEFFAIPALREDPWPLMDDGTPDECVAWIREWQTFLENCDGYTTQ